MRLAVRFLHSTSIRRIAGIAGIVGGVLLALNWFVPSATAEATAVGLIGLAMVGLCEFGLVHELRRAYPLWGIAGYVLLAVAGVVAVLGLAELLMAGAIVGVSLAAIGLSTWYVAAPGIALGCARAGLLSRRPAIATLIVTLAPIAATWIGTPALVSATFLVYRLVWVWLGYALLRSPAGTVRLYVKADAYPS